MNYSVHQDLRLICVINICNSNRLFTFKDGHSSHGHQAGLLILKRIPKGHQDHHHHQDTKTSAYKPSGPSAGTIVTKFLGASSSLDPYKPAPFGHTAIGDTPHSFDNHDNHEIHPTSHNSDTFGNTGSGIASHNVDGGINIPPTAADYGLNDNAPASTGSGNLEPPATSYGIPFEKAPSYLDQNVEDYITSDTKNTQNSLPPPSATPINPNNNINNKVKHPEPVFQYPHTKLPKPSSSNQHSSPNYLTMFQNLDPRNPDNQQISGNGETDQYKDNKYKQPGYVGNSAEGLADYSSKDQLNYNQYPPLGGQSIFHQTVSDPAKYPNILDYPQGFPPAVGNGAVPFSSGGFQSLNSYDEDPLSSFLINVHDNVPSASMLASKPTANASPSPYLESPKETSFLPTPNSDQPLALPSRYPFIDPNTNRPRKTKRKPSRTKNSSSKRPSSSSKPKQTNLNIVKSVAYELGPDGPKRLT